MDNIYKLKTQLEEAARFANSPVPGHDRMAVILMDNFVELQLGRQMLFKFRLEFLNNYKDLKYPLDKRHEILDHYDELLKACKHEGLITTHQRSMLAFCHGIRNRLYHQGDDDSLLIKIALHILHDIIVQRQPEWQGGTDIIRVPFTMDGKSIDMEHPFTKQRRKELGSKAYETGSKEDWSDFVEHNFNILTEDRQPAKLLAEFLSTGVERLNCAMNYALMDDEKKDGFDALMLLYSFKVNYRDDLQRIREMQDKKEAKMLHNKLYARYKKSYKPLSIKRIESFKTMSKKLENLSSGEALERYLSVRTDFFLMYDSLMLAAQEMEKKNSDQAHKHYEKIKKKARKSNVK